MQDDLKKFDFDKSRVRILVVDDDASIREMISTTLKDDGWFVETAETGKAAFQKLSAQPFHIVLTDIQMPEMTGIELLEVIKKKSPHIEVMIMTSNASVETAIKAIKSGAYDYLNKPFDDLMVIPKKMTQIAEKILLRQQNLELMKRLKVATLNLRLLYEATRELNGILELDALRGCVLKALPQLQQRDDLRAAWYSRSDAGWSRTTEASDEALLPELIEMGDLEEFCRSHPSQKLKAVALEYEGQISEGIVFESNSDFLAEMFFQEVKTSYAKIRMHARWVGLANRDGLTMLHNHRYFQERLRQEFSQAKRQNGALSVLLIDVDHFKKYNDQNGHPAGDELLKQLSRLLDSEIGNRESDVVARYGGEEFVFLLPFTPLDGAMIKAKRIQEAVAAHAFPNASGQPLGMVSVSVGVASYPRDCDDAAALVERADQALYAAKKAGRNCVMSFDSVGSEDSKESVRVEVQAVAPSVQATIAEPEIEVVPKTTLADVVDFGEDLPDPSKLTEELAAASQPSSAGTALKPMGTDAVSLDALMSSIDSAFEEASQQDKSHVRSSDREVKRESSS